MDDREKENMLSVMLMNDAPMSELEAILGIIQHGIKHSTNIESLDILRVKNVYGNIDLSRLTEETGKSIIEETKKYIEEFYALLEPLWKDFVKSGYKPYAIPARLKELSEVITKNYKIYRELKNMDLYRKAWDVGYFQYPKGGCKTRDEWFDIGKQTIINSSKLTLVTFSPP